MLRALANGIAQSWYEVGRGHWVVLIHGLGDDHRAWRKVLPSLMLDHRVLLYDLRGHGASDLGDAEGTLHQLSEDLRSLMDALEIPKAILVGFSLGGTIAMRVAIDHPARVAGLVLIGTSSRVNSAAAGWYLERAEAVERSDPALRRTLDDDTENVYREQPGEIQDGLTIRRQSTSDPAGYANACRAMYSLHSKPLDDELSGIAVPTVLVAGEADQHCPPKASQIIADRIKGSSVRILPGTGHPIPVERPDEVVEEIRRLSSSISPAQTASANFR